MDAGDCAKKNVYKGVSFRSESYIYLCKWLLI